MRLLLLFATLLLPIAQATPAWALEPLKYEDHSWVAIPQGGGKTVYRDGFNTIEVSPTGPYSSTYNSYSSNGKQETGTIFNPYALPPPQPSLTERLRGTERELQHPLLRESLGR